MKFKKLMGLFMVSSLAVGSLVGCGDKETNADTTLDPHRKPHVSVCVH